MVAFYRIKPEVVQAVQWTGDNMDELSMFTTVKGIPKVFMNYVSEAKELRLITADSKYSILISEGDYVIKDTSGEFTVLNPEIFKKTYESVAVNKD